MTELTASASSGQTGSGENPPANDTGDLASVLQRVDGLVEDRSFGAARAELDLAFGSFGEQAKLLTRLAVVYWEGYELDQAMTTYRRAVGADPNDPEVAADFCRFLHAQGMQRMAMDFVTGLPADVTANSRVREALGLIYLWGGWAALAVDAYGDSRGLSRVARSRRRRLWWRSGGPVPTFRRWARNFDNQVRRNWYEYSESISVLDDLGVPSGFAAASVRGEVDAYLQAWAFIGTKMDVRRRIASHWAARYALVSILACATVFLTLNVTRPDISAGKTAFLAVVAAAAGLMLLWPLRAFVNVGPHFVFQGIRAILAETALITAGTLIIAAVAAPPAWPGVVGIILLSVSGMSAMSTAVWNLPGIIYSLQVRSLMRYRPRAAVLDRLLDLLSEVRHPDTRNDLTKREYWMWLLEAAA